MNTLTGEGLAEVLEDAAVVVDVSNSPSFADDDVMAFFRTSTSNLLAAEKEAGVGHHVALSVVGTDRLQESGYFRAKQAQEDLIKESGIPYSIVHATQFFEFMKGITAAATKDDDTVHLAPIKIQPICSDDVAAAVGRSAVGNPLNGVVEVAGADTFQLDELIRTHLAAMNDPRTVVSDPGPRTSVRSSRRPHCSPAPTPVSARSASPTGSPSSSRHGGAVCAVRHTMSAHRAASGRDHTTCALIGAPRHRGTGPGVTNSGVNRSYSVTTQGSERMWLSPKSALRPRCW